MLISDGHAISQQAMAAVGSEGVSDWNLRDAVHGSQLPPAAGPLQRALRATRVQQVLSKYAQLDMGALEGQRTFFRLARIETYARRIEAIAKPLAIGIALLFIGPILLGVGLGDLTKIADSAVVSGVAFSIEWVALVLIVSTRLAMSELRPYERWLSTRANAERARFELVDAILASDEPSEPGELPLLALQLEYYVRYFLRVNQAYFRARVARNPAAGTLRSRLGWAVIMFLAIAWAGVWFASYAGYIPLGTIWIERSFFVVAGCAAFVLGTKKSIGELQSDERANLARSNLLDNLNYIEAAYLPTARAAARKGDKNAVMQFVALVQSQVLAEFTSIVRLRNFDTGGTATERSAIPPIN